MITAVYDPFAASFAESRNKPWPDIDELFEKLAGVDSNFGMVLDVGCGSGRLFPIVSANGRVDGYIGTDISGELLKIAKNTYPEAEYFQQDMRHIGQVRHGFDTIFLVASLHHILETQEQLEILIAIKNLLNPNGRIALLNWNLQSQRYVGKYAPREGTSKIFDIPFRGFLRSYYAFDAAEIDHLLKDAGYNIQYSGVSRTDQNFISIAV